jgi:hypothetical protein
MNTDLDSMLREELVIEVRKLRRNIREYRDRRGHHRAVGLFQQERFAQAL